MCRVECENTGWTGLSQKTRSAYLLFLLILCLLWVSLSYSDIWPIKQSLCQPLLCAGLSQSFCFIRFANMYAEAISVWLSDQFSRWNILMPLPPQSGEKMLQSPKIIHFHYGMFLIPHFGTTLCLSLCCSWVIKFFLVMGNYQQNCWIRCYILGLTYVLIYAGHFPSTETAGS